MRSLLITCALFFCVLTSQAQSGQPDGHTPARLAGPDQGITVNGPIAQSREEARPCPYAKAGQNPSGVEGHKDGILPVEYGLQVVGPKTGRRARRGETKDGGCVVSNCDPYYYCTLHKKYL
jgi:hypothetical protein